MDTKIQELTEKIYLEGVEKGKAEAERLVAEATRRRDAIISEAEAEARRKLSEAEAEVTEKKRRGEAELRLYAAQAVEALKSEVANVIAGRIASSNVKAAVADKGYMQRLIVELVRGWAQGGGLTVETAEAESLREYFAANAKDLLNKGVRIEQVNGRATSFTISPSDGSYKVSFGEEEFMAFFTDFLRPQLVEMLFGQGKAL